MTLTQTIARPTPDISYEERDVLWRNAVKHRLANLKLQPSNGSQGWASHKARDLGDVLITDWRCPDLEGVRGSSMAASGPECLLLFMMTTGRQILQTPQATVVLRPGNMLLMSSRTTGKIVIPEKATKRTVRVPLTALAPYDTGAGIPDFLCLDTTENPLARLTQEYLGGVDSQLRHMSPVDIEGARNALLVLIAGMIRSSHAPDVKESDFLPFLRRALEDWIADHLREGPIRAADLAAAHSVAPRTVHRAFAATGDTMGAVVRAHRLAAARNDLVHTSGSVAAIAHRWGFCDASHLGREFRREFAMSPGDYRAAHGIA